MEQVRFLPDWYTNTNYTGLYVAAARGYFADAGLAVAFLPMPRDHRVAAAVAAGQVEFGICYQEQITLARAAVAPLPIVSVAAIMQHNTTGFLALASSGITRPRDLAGKRYAAVDSPQFRAVLGTIMREDGADVGSVRAMNLGVTDLIPALVRGEADFAWVFAGWEGVDAARRDLDTTLLRITDYPIVPDYYTPCIIANEATIATRPEVVRGFVAAASRGYEEAARDPEAAATILAAADPTAPADLIAASQRVVSPWYRAEAARWGEQRLDVWQRFAQFMREQRLIERPVDAAHAFTNAFLP